MRLTVFALWTILPLTTAAVVGPAWSQEDAGDLYQQGLALREAGDWGGALALWDSARALLARDGHSDPRIGVAYLETVVRRGADWRYADGCEMYIWGFGGTNLEEHAEAVREEVERIIPILELSAAERWRSELEEGVTGVAPLLMRFWVERDPTPQDATNERLIEHWRRIVHSRENFTYNRKTVYGTDDRGLIYVKYGEPGHKRAGTLGVNEMELRIWVENSHARDQLRRLDPHPTYEVWVYDGLRGMELTYFLFGNRGGKGQFELVGGVEDLISDDARSPNTRRYTPGAIRAFYFIQLFYYADLAVVGGPYAQRHEELAQLWGQAESRGRSLGYGFTPPRETTVQAVEFRYREENEANPAFRPVVASKSDVEAREREVEVIAWPVRVLSTENEQRLVLLVFSSPRLSLSGIGEAGTRFEIPDHSMRHTLIARDASYQEIGQVSQWVTGELEDISSFTLRHVGDRLYYTILAEAFPRTDRELPLGIPLASAQTVIDNPEPLSVARDRLEVSDILSGIGIPAAYSDESFPFPVLPARKVWLPDPVKVYFEVYHLTPDADGVARFRADFQVTPVSAYGQAEPTQTVNLSLDFESETDRKAVAVDIASLPEGAYQLEVTVTDVISGQSVTRLVPVEVDRALPEMDWSRDR